MKKIGYFAGSFNPFTIGHADIVERALRLFDEIVIGVGINIGKCSVEDVEARLKPISDLYEGDPRVKVVTYSSLTVDAAEAAGATALVRSVRNVADYEYESNMADINRRLSGLETVLFMARPELACISSSMVRELARFGHAVEEYLPSKKKD